MEVTTVFSLLGGLGLFLFGIKTMGTNAFHRVPCRTYEKNSAQHLSPPLRRINQPFQRIDAAYALVIGGRVVVERQNQFGVRIPDFLQRRPVPAIRNG